MSIAEQDSHGLPDPPEDYALPADGWGDGPASYAPGEAPSGRPGERVPPQDMAAEQSVLGAMLLSKDSIADVVETVGSTSAHAGDKAMIDAAGAVLAGWVGGGCAEATVRQAAQDCLSDGTPRLIGLDLDDEVLGVGRGSSKRKAQLNAAEQAWHRLDSRRG